MNSILIVGLLGMACILTAFILNVFRKLDSHGRVFLLLNLAGSVLLALYAYALGSLPFLILNIVWTIVAIWGLLHHS